MKKFFIKTLLHIGFCCLIVNANPKESEAKTSNTQYRILVEESLQDLNQQRLWLINFLASNKNKIKAEKHKKMERMIHNLNRRINLLKAQLCDFQDNK